METESWSLLGLNPPTASTLNAVGTHQRKYTTLCPKLGTLNPKPSALTTESLLGP